MSFAGIRRSLFGGRRPAPSGRARERGRARRAELELLESRLVLSTLSTWSGAASDAWSDKGNWDNVPMNGNDLAFPSVTNTTSNNDLAGMNYNTLTVSGTGYTISGDGVALAGPIDSSQPTGTNTVSLPIAFSGAGAVAVDKRGDARGSAVCSPAPTD